MPIITAIKPQKNNKRVNIYLDDKFAFGLDLENFITNNLRVEQNLTQSEIDEITQKGEIAKAYEKALRFSMTRPRSQKEINDWFVRKKINETIQKTLTKRLVKLNLIDDDKFASWWIDQRVQFKNKSKRELEFELRKKGISKDIIVKSLEKFNINDAHSAYSLLVKKKNTWRRFERNDAKQRMSRYLSGKGFSWTDVKDAVSRYGEELEDSL